MVTVLFAAAPDLWPLYEAPLRTALAEAGLHDVTLCPNPAPDLTPEGVDYIVYAPHAGLRDFRPFTRARAVLSLWAGVEGIVDNPTLTQPLCRMVDGSLRQGMVEWVCGQVLRHHLGLDRLLAQQDGTWAPQVPPLAHARPIGILGLGELGQACGQALAGLGFPVTGWSRRAHDVPGLTCRHGAEGLATTLAGSAILVLLLPLTPATEGLLDATALTQLPRGAVLLNPGRGALIDDDALIAALDSGQIAHATLDVFRQEPLPPAHPFWAHPQVTVSPHVAAETRPESAARVIAENIRRSEAGEDLLHRVDRAAGY
ncbi:glyoxylate/hydroxypyruvate reductase A [Pseudooceanicola sp.]|uniref:2-hydroxyacid dehydrogenase n=1 Tax=Pseudooceanicola sp. TaxID=1914328 RepID=UPI0026111075|nr:glyoxylate/hydroxypyruvate reductase A [Pseudooceanicola sp.]MDF1856096.1 glyoxylate/hydroxypyruvate reductase A [Pseudooceanicola sp.]